LLYENVGDSIIKPIINIILKQAFDAKGMIINFMKGDVTVKLPFEIYLDQIKNFYINGALVRTLALTTVTDDYNFVSGYDFISSCLWPHYLKTLDQQLSFVFSSANLSVFHRNYL